MASASTNQASLLLQKQLKGNDPILNLFVKNTVLERIRNFFFFYSFADLCKNPVDGFSAGLVDESNIFEWSVTIIGPPDTL